MPTVALFDRGHDCIEEFDRAATQRYAEALVLDKRSHKLAAIYLYGYSVELRLKAAYFRNAGFAPSQLITKADRDSAVAMWQILGISRQPGQHDILGWAELAVASRVTTAMPPYGRFGTDIIGNAAAVYLIWREYLRYRSGAPAASEWRVARKVATWFSLNYHRMR